MRDRNRLPGFVFSLAVTGAACEGPRHTPVTRPAADLARIRGEIRAGRLLQALALLDERLEANPGDVAALREHAFVHVELRNLTEARRDLEKAIEMAPDFAWSHYKLGFVLGLLGETDEAIACHTRAIELDPGFAMAYQNRGWLRQEARDFEGAIEDYTRVLEQGREDDPLHRDCLWSRSQCYFRVGKDVEGRRDQDRFYATTPN